MSELGETWDACQHEIKRLQDRLAEAEKYSVKGMEMLPELKPPDEWSLAFHGYPDDPWVLWCEGFGELGATPAEAIEAALKTVEKKSKPFPYKYCGNCSHERGGNCELPNDGKGCAYEHWQPKAEPVPVEVGSVWGSKFDPKRFVQVVRDSSDGAYWHLDGAGHLATMGIPENYTLYRHADGSLA